MEKLTRNNLIYGGIIALFAVLLILSSWQIWTIYETIWPMPPFTLTRSFSLLPSAFSDEAWLFYDTLPILSWLNIFGGICILVGVPLFFMEVKMYKTLIMVGKVDPKGKRTALKIWW